MIAGYLRHLTESAEETALDGVLYLSDIEELETILEGKESKEVAGLVFSLLQKLVMSSNSTSRILPVVNSLHYNILANFFPACTPTLVNFVTTAATPEDNLLIVKVLLKIHSSMASYAEQAVNILMMIDPPETHQDSNELAHRCFDCLMHYVSKVRARPTGKPPSPQIKRLSDSFSRDSCCWESWIIRIRKKQNFLHFFTGDSKDISSEHRTPNCETSSRPFPVSKQSTRYSPASNPKRSSRCTTWTEESSGL